METVLPKLHAFGGTFPWRDHEFIVRDLKWVDLATHQPSVPYFYSQCLQAARKGQSKAPIFKTKQFGLMVVVPEAQWTEFEDWQEANEMVCIFFVLLRPTLTHTYLYRRLNAQVVRIRARARQSHFFWPTQRNHSHTHTRLTHCLTQCRVHRLLLPQSLHSTHPALHSTHPALRLTHPALRLTHPALRLTHPALRLTHPISLHQLPLLVSPSSELMNVQSVLRLAPFHPLTNTAFLVISRPHSSALPIAITSR